MRVYFSKTNSELFSELITYSSLNPIPFTLKLDRFNILPETIYTRNLSGENFIELRFNKETKQLYEITVVAVQENTAKFDIEIKVNNDDFFECYIDDNSELDISKPIQILRTDKSLSFCWSKQVSKTYSIAKNCILGIDNYDNLCYISLTCLNEDIIYNILGF